MKPRNGLPVEPKAVRPIIGAT